MGVLFSLARWLRDNLDPVAALSLAVLFSFLGIAGVASQDVLSNAVLATLAVIAFTLVRERSAREALKTGVAASTSQLEGSVDEVRDDLRSLRATVEEVGLAVEHVDRQLALLDSLIKPTTAQSVRRDFEHAMVATDRWVYKGGTGTFLRAVTLPTNGENALKDKKPRRITIEILDPTNVDVCARYGRHRAARAPGPDRFGEAWTTQRVRNESYATILAASYHRHRHALLDIQLGLCGTMSAFRYDLSSGYILITQEDGTAPALKAMSGTFFYDSYEVELRLSFEQSRHLDLAAGDAILDPDTVTESEVRKLFEALGVPLDASFSSDDLQSIIRKALKAENPYA
jgi:hypothetical protein